MSESKLRYTAGLRRLYRRARGTGRSTGRPQPPDDLEAEAEDRSYQTWIGKYDALDEVARQHLRQQCALLEHQPSISLVLVLEADARHLRATIESVVRQLYPNWQLCIAADGRPDPATVALLAEYEAGDDRISVVRDTGHTDISAASNAALRAATGEWAAQLHQDDELAVHALALVAMAIEKKPRAAMIYSDQDRLDDRGHRHSPFFKPDFDPLLLLGQDYISGLCVMRRALMREVGGLRPGFAGSEDWDLLLRVSELVDREEVVHIPYVLYHCRVPRPSTAALPAPKDASAAGQRAVADHLRRTGRKGEVSSVPSTGWNRVRWELPESPPLVSVVIPTRDGQYLSRCIESITRSTTYPHFEIVVVDNGSQSQPVLEYLGSHSTAFRVIRDEGPFNFAALNNAAVHIVSGELVCILNDDTEVRHADWLEEMVGQVLQPGVGVVGAKLYYPDDTVQHAGVLLGLGLHKVAGHAHQFDDRLADGFSGRSRLAQTLSAVTGACLLVRKAVWDELGGLDAEHLRIAFNDIDFCLRAREAGWRVTWTPFAELTHHESLSRGPDVEGPRAAEFQKEARYMAQRWGQALQRDPAYNPNLSLMESDFALAWPPRARFPLEN